MDHSSPPPPNYGGGLLQYGSSTGEAEEADIENFPKRQKSIANNNSTQYGTHPAPPNNIISTTPPNNNGVLSMASSTTEGQQPSASSVPDLPMADAALSLLQQQFPKSILLQSCSASIAVSPEHQTIQLNDCFLDLFEFCFPGISTEECPVVTTNWQLSTHWEGVLSALELPYFPDGSIKAVSYGLASSGEPIIQHYGT